MEIIYFARSSFPFYTIAFILFIFIFIIVYFLNIRKKYLNLREINSTNFRWTPLFRPIIQMIVLGTLLIWFIYPDLSSIYLVERYSDGTLKLKNVYNIPLGTIYPSEKIDVEYKLDSLRGTSRRGNNPLYAVISTNKKSYKTLRTNSLNTLKEKIIEMKK